MAHHVEASAESDAREGLSRRELLDRAASCTMAVGLAAGYGTLAAMAVRYLYPAAPDPKAWVFVKEVSRFRRGESVAFKAPNGQSLVITRLQENGDLADFIALSSVCPHLGCMVHWEPAHQRFFCPCHNGAFDPQGNPTEGPPFLAQQVLTRFPLDIANGLLFVEVPV